MTEGKTLIANPEIVLREEFDDWALLFDPDSGNAFGLNPTSVFIWKCFDGKHTKGDIIKKVADQFNNVPAEAEEHYNTFVGQLTEKGLVKFSDN